MDFNSCSLDGVDCNTDHSLNSTIPRDPHCSVVGLPSLHTAQLLKNSYRTFEDEGAISSDCMEDHYCKRVIRAESASYFWSRDNIATLNREFHK